MNARPEPFRAHFVDVAVQRLPRGVLNAFLSFSLRLSFDGRCWYLNRAHTAGGVSRKHEGLQESSEERRARVGPIMANFGGIRAVVVVFAAVTDWQGASCFIVQSLKKSHGMQAEGFHQRV